MWRVWRLEEPPRIVEEMRRDWEALQPRTFPGCNLPPLQMSDAEAKHFWAQRAKAMEQAPEHYGFYEWRVQKFERFKEEQTRLDRMKQSQADQEAQKKKNKMPKQRRWQ